MSSDNTEKFKAIFLEEAADLISELEDCLLGLEKNQEDPAIIERIFRAMHTIKGSSNMFGFDTMGKFTHELESIYDEIRSGTRKVDGLILEITLQSVDHLRNLTEDLNLDDPSNKEKHTQLSTQLSQIKADNAPKTEKKVKEAATKQTATYKIDFAPVKDIFKTGNNLIYLMEEMAQLGLLISHANTDRLPDLDDFEAGSNYLKWNFLLVTQADQSQIEDVFIFVEDLADIDIIKLADSDLLSGKEGKERIAHFKETGDVAEIGKKEVSDKKDIAEDNEFIVTVKKEKSLQSIKVSSDKLDKLMNMVSELVTTQARLSLFNETHYHPELEAITEEVEKLTRQLRDNAFSMSLVPIDMLSTKFRRLVRDLSNQLGKKVDFLVEGGDTELDKSIIDSLSDPLLHILRNSLDHGLEMPDVREKQGKPATGTIRLKSYYSGAHVIIEIIDDGAGINTQKVLQKAKEKGLINKDAELTEHEIVNLIMMPGFSTATAVTDVSGRGVGMDVVSKRINELRGDIQVFSEQGKGTRIKIFLPLTLSIIDGLLVHVGETKYIIPLSAIDKIYDVHRDQINHVFHDMVTLDGEQVPFHNIRKLFETEDEGPEIQQVVVVQYEGHRVGVTVDQVLGEYQAVLKPLGKAYKNIDMINGATILGDGSIALIMDTNRIIRNYSSELVKATT